MTTTTKNKLILKKYNYCWVKANSKYLQGLQFDTTIVEAYIQDIRQNNHIEIIVNNRWYLVPRSELRQCKCNLSGKWHKHATDKHIKTYATLGENH